MSQLINGSLWWIMATSERKTKKTNIPDAEIEVLGGVLEVRKHVTYCLFGEWGPKLKKRQQVGTCCSSVSLGNVVEVKMTQYIYGYCRVKESQTFLNPVMWLLTGLTTKSSHVGDYVSLLGPFNGLVSDVSRCCCVSLC